jgi:3-deoxy-manno-octulosonate cytidylyltransferase (CMP-KDO synthetase)
MKVVGVIPARYASSRLPGKPLADICGRPMIWWVYQQAKKASKLNAVYAAIDDERILSVCQQYDIPVIMTKNTHLTSINRLQEISTKIKADFYIQINGDEPLIQPELVDLAIPDAIPLDTEYGTNIITKIFDPVEVLDASNIKVIFDRDMNILYMSRTPIPYPFKMTLFHYYKHVGIIGYNEKMLNFYANTTPVQLELIEGIDPLRFIDYGKHFFGIKAENCKSLSVDTAMDLEKVRTIIQDKIRRGEIPPPPR